MLRKNLSPFHTLTVALLLLAATACTPPRAIGGSVPANNPSFLFLSDIHLNTFSDSTAYRDDTGMALWKAFLSKADAVLASAAAPRFIVYTGDLPAHYDCDPSCYLAPDKRASHNQNLQVILSGLRDLATKYHKPLFYMPGNNDGLAGDYYSFADAQQLTPFSLVPEKSNPFPALNILPDSTKAPCIVSNPQPKLGYYSARPVEGLRLICLNTVIYDTSFVAVDGTNQLADGNAQMLWLAGQLAEAQNQQEKVYIAMHIPPGIDAYGGGTMWVKLAGQKKSWQDQFLSLTSQYQNSISGILYGHTHMDEVRRLYDSTGNITTVAISCPGVTPQHKNNPGFKTVTYDGGNKQLLDFTTYYTLPNATIWGNNTYTFRNTYPGKPNATIYQRLSALPLTTVGDSMNAIFMVKHGLPTYNTQRGIEVKWGQ